MANDFEERLARVRDGAAAAPMRVQLDGTFGERLRQARQARSLTKTDLADRAGLTDRSILNYEQGKRLPDVRIAALLARELGISVADLIPPVPS